MSNCEEVQEILAAVGRGEAASAPGTRFLQEHLEGCPECRRRMANERMLSAGLAAVAASTMGVPPASMKAALLAEFRRRRAMAPMRRPASHWPGKRVGEWVAAGAIAAGLLMAIAGWLQHGEQAAPQAKAPVVAITTAPSTAAASSLERHPPAKAAAVVKAQAHRTPRRANARPKPQALQAEEDPEVATDFIAIPYVEPLRPDQRADVFRVQMPRANMAAFGLPVVGGRLDSRITADVLMGEDGVVRAVRFIR